MILTHPVTRKLEALCYDTIKAMGRRLYGRDAIKSSCGSGGSTDCLNSKQNPLRLGVEMVSRLLLCFDVLT